MGHNRPAPYGQSRLLGLEKMYLIIVQVFAVPLRHISFCELVPPKDSSCLLIILHFRHMQEYAEYTDPPASQRHKASGLQALPPALCYKGGGQEYGPLGLLCTRPRKFGKRNMYFGYSVAVAHGNPESMWTLFPSFQGQMEFPFRKILAPVSSEQLYATGRLWDGSGKRCGWHCQAQAG